MAFFHFQRNLACNSKQILSLELPLYRQCRNVETGATQKSSAGCSLCAAGSNSKTSGKIMCHGHWKSARDKYVNTVHLYAAKLNMFSAFRIILEVMTLLKQYHMP